MTKTTSIHNMNAAERKAAARQLFRDSAAQGYPLTGSELAERFERGERWGQERIREVKEEAKSSPARFPGEVELEGLPPVAPTPPSLPQSPIADSAETAERTAEAQSGPQSEPQEPQEPQKVQDDVSAESAEMILGPQTPHAPIAESAEPQDAPQDAAEEPQAKRKPVRVWPVVLLMLPASVAIWGGWVGLGEKAGFGKVNLLPGIANIEVNTAITLPIGMEVYAAYALYVWLSGRARGKALKFAKWSAIIALVVGALGQIAYHIMEAAGVVTAPWQITAAVACLPVAVLGMGAALAHMVKAEDE